MPHEVIMPALGMAQDTGLIVAWHKTAGDAVAVGDVLFEVETDKATMEVEAAADGILSQVRHAAGDEVPVGAVIAVIGGEAEAAAEAPAPAAPEPAAAEPAAAVAGHAVIMPALGMAQDSGLILAWHKAPGDAVAADDILFEVETDKSAMEVEAGRDGFVAELRAEAGEEAPVGAVIAIISDKLPSAPVQRSMATQPKAAADPAPPTKAAPPTTPPTKAAPPQAAPAPVPAGGRVLASPKARRLALEQGLDLYRLAAAGHPQPYHVKDLDALRALPDPAAAPQPAAAAARHLVAEVPEDGFAAFADWAAQQIGLTDPRALLAGLAAASLGPDTATIAVESRTGTRTFLAAPGPLSAVAEAGAEATPDLRLRDLRFDRIASVRMGAEDIPVLTLTRRGAGLSLTLECAGDQLSARQALDLVSGLAGRLEQPLRHLL